MKCKELLVIEDDIKTLVSSSSQGLAPTYIEKYFSYDYQKLVRIALQNLVLGGELIYDEHLKLHLKSEVKEQTKMNKYNNIKEVFAALAEGKKLKKVRWEKDTYISIRDNFLFWTSSGKETFDPYCDSFDGSWEEYIEESFSVDDLEVGVWYKHPSLEFVVVYKGEQIILCKDRSEKEFTLYRNNNKYYTRV